MSIKLSNKSLALITLCMTMAGMTACKDRRPNIAVKTTGARSPVIIGGETSEDIQIGTTGADSPAIVGSDTGAIIINGSTGQTIVTNGTEGKVIINRVDAKDGGVTNSQTEENSAKDNNWQQKQTPRTRPSAKGYTK